ncbi:OmpA family protein [Pedobacter sp. SYSU D00535]|uniref:OmpA family protein n=1 Tax=Pedobacter sp. SYSU D00535 TaxID=2810308 RepID=UPI001A9616D1|nr:OmpA family protein [Pedobacter sp. SYSU D00535]
MKAKVLYLLTALFLGSMNVFAQDQPGLREKADLLYQKYQYAKAVVLYNKLAEKKNPYLGDLVHLADSYRKMNDYEAAEKWYAQLVAHPKSNNEHLLAYAEVLKLNAKYSEAKQIFQRYASNTGKEQDRAIAACDSAEKWMQSEGAYELKNEELLNTPRSEFSVFSAKDRIYYTGEPGEEKGETYGWTGNSFLKIFSAEKTGGKVADPVLSQEVFNQQQFHSGPLVSNKAGTVFMVTRTSNDTDGKARGEAKHPTRRLELIIYEHNEVSNSWTAQPFKYNSKQYSIGHAALSTDEKTLYFSSDMAGGFGGADLWFSQLQPDGSWGVPQNCGAALNTGSDELFPTISSEDMLYFSSKGHPGMGGLDIFSSRGAGKDWSAPLNLKYPVNSSADDFSFIETPTATGATGFFSSNRKGGKGSDDIYSFSYTAPPKFALALKGQVVNKQDGTAIKGAKISVFQNGEFLKDLDAGAEQEDFFLALDKNNEYKLLVRRKGFLPDSATLSTKGMNTSDTLDLALSLEPLLVKGKTIRLNNIFYDLGKDNIRPEAATVLNSLELILRENPTLKIELSSHTDSRGKDASNLALSQRRAQSAVNYLVSRGIARERMVAKGYGETRLINKCGKTVVCPEEEHQKNRRSEFRVLSY